MKIRKFEKEKDLEELEKISENSIQRTEPRSPGYRKDCMISYKAGFACEETFGFWYKVIKPDDTQVQEQTRYDPKLWI